MKIRKLDDPYGAIYQRKSIRNYNQTPLDEDVLEEIRGHIDGLKPLHDGIRTELRILTPEDVRRRVVKRAPHYLAAFSEDKDSSTTNVGYLLQQMDLLFSANGIGSCWQGIPKPTEEVLRSSDLDFVILMAFGRPAEELHRSSVSQFRRKPLSEITDISGANGIVEAARLAPTGCSEPWFFTGDEDVIHTYSAKPGLGYLKGLLAERLIPVDMGIALYHLQAAGEHFGRRAEFVIDEAVRSRAPQSRTYVGSTRMA